MRAVERHDVWLQDSPIGALGVAAVGDTVVRIDLSGDVLAVLAALPSEGRLLDAPPRGAVARELDEYFAGTRSSFDLAVDLTSVGGFHRSVLETLHAEVCAGEVVTYGELAALAGRPGAARAVGQAMHRNPVPVVVPCHRVVASGGSLGGYGGGLALKQSLLELEGALVPA